MLSLYIDVTETLAYLEKIQSLNGVKVTMTHYLLKALGLAFVKTPGL